MKSKQGIASAASILVRVAAFVGRALTSARPPRATEVMPLVHRAGACPVASVESAQVPEGPIIELAVHEERDLDLPGQRGTDFVQE